MGDGRDGQPLHRIAAELRGEIRRLDRCAVELADARGVLGKDSQRLSLYGIAALLETFYTAMEKVLLRVANSLGGVPEGPNWQRALLEGACLDVPKVRPPVLSEESVHALERYLAFRHRFRNLYLFDLDPEPLAPLVDSVAGTWAQCRTELEAFAATLDTLADAI